MCPPTPESFVKRHKKIYKENTQSHKFMYVPGIASDVGQHTGIGLTCTRTGMICLRQMKTTTRILSTSQRLQQFPPSGNHSPVLRRKGTYHVPTRRRRPESDPSPSRNKLRLRTHGASSCPCVTLLPMIHTHHWPLAAVGGFSTKAEARTTFRVQVPASGACWGSQPATRIHFSTTTL